MEHFPRFTARRRTTKTNMAWMMRWSGEDCLCTDITIRKMGKIHGSASARYAWIVAYAGNMHGWYLHIYVGNSSKNIKIFNSFPIWSHVWWCESQEDGAVWNLSGTNLIVFWGRKGSRLKSGSSYLLSFKNFFFPWCGDGGIVTLLSICCNNWSL